jgi:hypothetical protein
VVCPKNQQHSKFPDPTRLLLVIVIMLDTIRRWLFRDARPIDTAMLVVELLVLAIILAEFVWKICEWLGSQRKAKKEIELRLNFLNISDANSLSHWILEGLLPPDDKCRYFATEDEHGPALVERDYVHGWVISPRYKGEMKKWAKKRTKDK